jgi:transcriptional regulator with XRE-family HTH domain
MAAWLRWLRQRRGLSLRALETMTGITDSELNKIETARQECRLSSFVRICSALGVPAGWVLDLMVQGDQPTFHQKVLNDAGFEVLMESLQINDKKEQSAIAIQLSAACALAAILLRVSAPLRRARFYMYPGADWQSRFLSFAQRLDSTTESVDRAVVIRALHEQPVAQLQRLGLLSRASLEEKRDDLRLPKKERRGLSFGGALWSLTHEEMAILCGVVSNPQIKELTDAETSLRIPQVKAQLPNLLERLKKATAETGKKSALAKFLSSALKTNVPLASVSRWLSGEREPGGEVTLQLLKWVELQERQAR